jgi:hypothetical protein
MAGVGALIVSLLTAALTFQQTRLMASQNQRVDIQNALAEAQRRADRMNDLGPILAQIENEKKESMTASKRLALCLDVAQRQCWRRLATTEGGYNHLSASSLGLPVGTPVSRQSHVYVPSEDVMGRIASLTHALRPYRALADEPADQECLSSPDKPPAPKLSEVRQKQREGPRDAQTFLSNVAGTYGQPAQPPATESVWRWTVNLIERMALELYRWAEAQLGDVEQARLSCSARSIERGQVLIALIGLGIDLSAIQKADATFAYADLREARLTGILLQDIDLSYADLRRAHLDGTILYQANLTGADLRGVKSSRATTRVVRNNFNNALMAGMPGPNLPTANDLSGLVARFRVDKVDFKSFCDSFIKTYDHSDRNWSIYFEARQIELMWEITVLFTGFYPRSDRGLDVWEGQAGGKTIYVGRIKKTCTKSTG